MGSKNLHFYQVSSWHWWCWSRDPTLQVTDPEESKSFKSVKAAKDFIPHTHGIWVTWPGHWELALMLHLKKDMLSRIPHRCYFETAGSPHFHSSFSMIARCIFHAFQTIRFLLQPSWVPAVAWRYERTVRHDSYTQRSWHFLRRIVEQQSGGTQIH